VLDVGYVEAGPPEGEPVLLLHGFRTIHSYVDVAPRLAAAGTSPCSP
jgi:pimeloyl-ACP methyl ester carboxylesterase